jgi:hypothetical protein
VGDSTPINSGAKRFSACTLLAKRDSAGASWVFASKNPCPGESRDRPGQGREACHPRDLDLAFSMPRPRRDETRKHQLNIRFTAREFARVHHHAGLLGQTPADFGRGVMLRRPRRKRREAPLIIAASDRLLRRWHALGLLLNGLAHRFNATGELPQPELAHVLHLLRRLLRRSFPVASAASYALAPALRYHLRKTCTNLVQIADRHRVLGLAPPVPLANLIARFRAVLNGDQPPHGA